MNEIYEIPINILHACTNMKATSTCILATLKSGNKKKSLPTNTCSTLYWNSSIQFNTVLETIEAGVFMDTLCTGVPEHTYAIREK